MASLIGILVLIVESKIREISDTIFIICISGICAFTLLLIFAVYASCCGKRCARFLLGVLFILVGLGALCIAILVWVKEEMIMDVVKKGWQEEYIGVGRWIESKLNCRGWGPIGSCHVEVRKFIMMVANYVGGVMLVITILCGIASFVALKYTCDGGEEDPNESLIQPSVIMSTSW